MWVTSHGGLYERAHDQQFEFFSYAKKLGLTATTLALFVPLEDEETLSKRSSSETIDGGKLHITAIGWVCSTPLFEYQREETKTHPLYITAGRESSRVVPLSWELSMRMLPPSFFVIMAAT